MAKQIVVTRSYTPEEWEKLSEIAKEHNCPSVTAMIHREASKIAKDPLYCAPCNDTSAVKIKRRLDIRISVEAKDKIECIARSRGLTAGEFLARAITDKLI